ncbi:MAG: hypothetical protein NVS4B3_22160 [Gemmatimonadaceae bacterium]
MRGAAAHRSAPDRRPGVFILVTGTMAILLLALTLLVGLVLIPLGLPGLWVMVGAAVAYPLLTGDPAIGAVTMGGTALLAFGAEVAEWTLASRYARKYGGSSRAGWGAMLGGVIGAIVGVPVPIIGSVVGAFVGSFLGALAFEYSRSADHSAATRVAWGALIGRVVAAAVKTGVGVAIAAWIVIAALRGA